MGSSECFLRFKAHRKGHTARRVTELSLEMPQTHTEALSNTCSWKIYKNVSLDTVEMKRVLMRVFEVS